MQIQQITLLIDDHLEQRSQQVGRGLLILGRQNL